MNPQNSNRSTRNKHIRRAALLMITPLLLAALAGFFFPFSNCLEDRLDGEDYRAKMEELTQLRASMKQLNQQLQNLQADFGRALELDRQWEAETPAARGPLKVSIEGLEGEMASRIKQIDPTCLDSLGLHVANAYDALLGARKTIWELRTTSIDTGSGGAAEKLEDCEDDLQDIRNTIRDVANNLASEADKLSEVESKGIFGNKKETKEAILRRTRALEQIVVRLRNL